MNYEGVNTDNSNYRGTISGLKVYVLSPVSETVRRSWRDRLFGWPWNPFKSKTTVWREPPLRAGECLRWDDTLYCREETWNHMNAALFSLEDQSRKVC